MYPNNMQDPASIATVASGARNGKCDDTVVDCNKQKFEAEKVCGV